MMIENIYKACMVEWWQRKEAEESPLVLCMAADFCCTLKNGLGAENQSCCPSVSRKPLRDSWLAGIP